MTIYSNRPIKSVKFSNSLIFKAFLIAGILFSTAFLDVKASSASEKTSPEVGFGEKSQEAILKEKPRDPKIGVLAPLSGELKLFGEDAVDGAELAADELNAKGGIKNNEFELLVYDTGGSMPGARLGVETFIKHSVVGVVGAATAEVSFASNKALNESQMILISAGSRRRLGDTGPYNFRNTMKDQDGISSLVQHIVEKNGWKRFAILTSLVNDYSIKLTAAFKASISKTDAKLSHELYFVSSQMKNVAGDETSLSAQVKKLHENTPDALIYTGDGEEAADLVKEMRAQGIDIPLIGGEDLMVPAFTALGKKAEGTLIYGGFNVHSASPNVKRFVDAFTKRYKRPPSRLAALSYDAYMLLADAIERAPSLRPTHVRLALLDTKDFRGVTGKVTFDATGEAKKDVFIFKFTKSSEGGYGFKCIVDPS